MTLGRYAFVGLVLSILVGSICATIAVFIARFYNAEQLFQIITGITGGFCGMLLITIIFHHIVNMYYADDIAELEKERPWKTE